MFSNITKLVVFGLLCFLMVEQSYRLYSVGWVAFSYSRMNSLTGILNSGLINLSPDPEIYYELKPNLDTYYKGVQLNTNSFGLADKEYSLEKPPGTLRVAVIGSSWSMASGVPTNASYHALLEDKFNSDPSTPKVEFINFSVEYYSLREIVAVVQKKVPEWEPDLIIIPVTFTTASIVFEGITANRELPPTMHPFFASFTLRELNRIGIPYPVPPDPYRKPTGDEGMGIFRTQLDRSLREVHKVSDQVGAKMMMLWLGFEPAQRRVLDTMEQVSSDTGMVIVQSSSIFLGSMREVERLRVSRFDRHPNEIAHQRIADVVESAILENDLLFGQQSL